MAKSPFVCQSCLSRLRQIGTKSPLLSLGLSAQRLASLSSQPSAQINPHAKDKFDGVFASQLSETTFTGKGKGGRDGEALPADESCFDGADPDIKSHQAQRRPKTGFRKIVASQFPETTLIRNENAVPIGESWFDEGDPNVKIRRAQARSAMRRAVKRRPRTDGLKFPAHPQYPLEDTEFWKIYDELAQVSLTAPDELAQASLTTPDRRQSWKANAHSLFGLEMNHIHRTVPRKNISTERKELAQWNSELGRLRRGQALQYREVRAGMVRRMSELYVGGQPGAMALAWGNLTRDMQRKEWPGIMALAIQENPEMAFRLFQDTFDHTQVKPYVARALIVYFIFQTIRQKTSPQMPVVSEQTQQEAFRMLEKLLTECPEGYFHFRQYTIIKFIQKCPSEDLATLHGLLIGYRHRLHHFTQLQFASRLAKIPAEKPLALDILLDLVQVNEFDINLPIGLSVCTPLLSYPETENESSVDIPVEDEVPRISPAELLDSMLDAGLSPNVITYSTMIRQLCLVHKLGTAWKVCDTMIDHGIMPDAYTYSILLNGAKHVEDWSSMCHVVGLSIQNDAHNITLWNDFLHGIFLAALIQARSMSVPRSIPAFILMVQAYIKIFDLQGLGSILPGNLDRFRDLGDNVSQVLGQWNFYHAFAPTINNLPLLPDSELIKPDSRTLATMVLGYVRGTSSVDSVIALYRNFNKLLQEGDEVAVRMVAEEGTIFHDIIIKSLCEREVSVSDALDVVADMLKAKDADGGALFSSDGASSPYVGSRPSHPAPSVRTWSILLNAFMFHRQIPQARRVMSMMRKHGVKPNHVTWNTLIAGAARMQNVDWTVRALVGMEAAGFPIDDFTNRAWGYLNNQAEAIEKLERAAEQKRKNVKALSGLDQEFEDLKQEVKGKVGLGLNWRNIWEGGRKGNEDAHV